MKKTLFIAVSKIIYSLTAMPPQGGIRCGEAAFIKALRAARPRPAAGWRWVNNCRVSYITLFLLAALPFSALAADETPDFAGEKLTGNWGGRRDSLFKAGISFDIYYKADGWRNFSGGVRRGNRALDNLDVKMTVDGEKAFDAQGMTLFLSLLNNNGARPNDLSGTSGGISNFEVPIRSFKFYEACVQQVFADDRFSVLAGLHDLNSEFYVTESSGLFLNPTYGIGTEMAATGDNGPSIFPYTALSVRLAWNPTDNTYLQGAIFDGVPGDPAHPRGTHIKFGDKDGALLVAEGGVRSDDIGHFGAGAWEYTARRPDQLAPAERKHSRGVYFLADKSVYKNGDRDISAFGRLGFTAGDVEQFRHGWSFGAVFSGFIPSRKDGQIGFGVSSAANSRKFKTANAPVDGGETQIELTYRDMLLPGLSFQPDLQYTVNPGTDPALKNAWTGGIRMGIDF
ncbi:MAG: carbohydrate porin [Pseudomonadota bacterium]